MRPRALALTLALTALVVACGPAASPTAEPSEPAPSAAASEVESASAEASATAEASVQPTQDAGGAPIFQNWALAAVRVDGLNVRTQPAVGAPNLVATDPETGVVGPLRLGVDDMVLVLSDAQQGDAHWWLRIAVDTGPRTAPVIGWAAAGTATDPWIEEDNSICGEPTLNWILALSDLQRVACYGNQAITFEAYPAVLPPDAGLGGACEVEPGQPDWLLCDNINYSWVNLEPGPDWQFQLHFDPASGIEPTGLVPHGTTPQRLRITGHFDDPAASQCANDALTEDESEALVWHCRGLFVVDEVGPAG